MERDAEGINRYFSILIEKQVTFLHLNSKGKLTYYKRENSDVKIIG